MNSQVLLFTDTNGVRGISRDAGSYRIASQLRAQGFRVQVVDFYSRLRAAQRSEVIRRYIGAGTLFVGFSTTHITALPAGNPLNVRRRHQEKALFPFSEDVMREWCEEMRRLSPNLKIVAGGYKTALQESFPEFIDHVFIGESDESAVNFARELAAGKGDQDFSVYPDGANSFRGFQSSMYLWDHTDFVFRGEHLPVETARGCVFACKFCNYNKKSKGEFVKSPSKFKEELIRNYELFGTTGYFFSDPLFNDSIEKVREFHAVLTSLPFEVEWATFARLDQFVRYPEMRELFLEAGAASIQFGIETMNPKSGIAIGKGLDPVKIIDTLHFLKEKWAGRVMMGSGFIIGLPNETVESAWKLYEWLISKDCPLDSFIFSELRIEHFESLLPKRSKYIDYSEISRVPEKFGYTLAADGHWSNAEMDKTRALELLLQFTRSPEALAKRRAGDYVIYNRLRNLGLSKEECFQTSLADMETLNRVDRRKDEIITSYHQKVCHA